MASLSTMLLTQFLCLSLCVYSVWTDIPETGSCTLEAGQNVDYWNMLTNMQMSERETVANGTKLLVRCPNIDYDYSVYYDEDATDGENVSQNYIVCVDGAFTEHTLACEKDTKSPTEASPSANKCTAIANGQITDRGKSFTCNTNYKPAFKNGMDAILYTRYSCTCNKTSGRLQCMGTEVECTPIGCQIPSHVQQGMTLYDPRERRTISAANRYEIQHNQSLIFSCEPSDVFYFEPNRRMFDCVKGSWVFKKRSDMDTWDFGNNGSFPECRKVVCPADYCKFGGHCIRDHECQCPEQTSGKQCETPLCNTECQNGGKCVSPDRCQCPEGFDGRRCEKGSAPGWKKSFVSQRTAKVKDSTKLFCRVKGKPRPFIDWFKNGVALADGNRVRITKYALEVMNTQLSDAGQYACKASNQHGVLWGNITLRVDINECAPAPCKNGAKCSNLQNAYSCKCVPGWQGKNCDQDVDECASNPCKYNATCNNLKNEYSCKCSPGWKGKNCDQERDPKTRTSTTKSTSTRQKAKTITTPTPTTWFTTIKTSNTTPTTASSLIVYFTSSKRSKDP